MTSKSWTFYQKNLTCSTDTIYEKMWWIYHVKKLESRINYSNYFLLFSAGAIILSLHESGIKLWKTLLFYKYGVFWKITFFWKKIGNNAVMTSVLVINYDIRIYQVCCVIIEDALAGIQCQSKNWQKIELVCTKKFG